MATAYHNLSDYDFNSVPNAENMRFGIVVSEWNNNITGPLLEGAISTLKKHGAKDKNILVQTVPGSFELTFGSAQMIKSGKVDAVIAIGYDRLFVPLIRIKNLLTDYRWLWINRLVMLSLRLMSLLR